MKTKTQTCPAFPEFRTLCFSIPAALILASSAPMVVVGEDLSFLPYQEFTTPGGIYPMTVAVADFNDDGNPDIAAVLAGAWPNGTPSSVEIFIGTGNGGMAHASSLPAGPNGWEIKPGDLNGDGHIDLAVANRSVPNQSGRVTWYPGNGDGTFGTGIHLAAGRQPHSLAIADLTGDGNPDMVVANHGDSGNGGSLQILAGDGVGGFSEPYPRIPSNGGLTDVVVEDVNGDKLPDILATKWFGGSVSILLGTGGGQFGTAVDHASGPMCNSLVTGDFNRDGAVDVATASATSRNLYLLSGNGDGTFQSTQQTALGFNSYELAVADINLDGCEDLGIAVTEAPSNRIAVLLGLGNGSFEPIQFFPAPAGAYGIRLADLNRDGFPDAATTHYVTSPESDRVAVHLLVPPDRPPVADAGPPQTVCVGLTAHLDGSASRDFHTPLADLKFEWWNSGDPRLSGADTITPFFKPERPGTYRVTVNVTDSVGQESQAETTVTAIPLILNGGFEDGTNSWISSGNMEVETHPVFTPSVPEGTHTLAFNSANRQPNGVISQSFETIPGMLYQLRFYAWTRSYNKRTQALGVTVKGVSTLLDKVINFKGSGNPNSVEWIVSTYKFTADSGTTMLAFLDRSTETNAIDLIIDDVSVLCGAKSLLVRSSPDAGVNVITNPPDLMGTVEGPTALRLVYNPGTLVRLSAPAAADGRAFDGWFRNGGRFSSQTDIDLVMNDDDQIEARYRDWPPRIVTQPVHASAVEGGTAVFSVTADGAEPFEYQWRFNGVDLTGERASELKIEPVDSEKAGGYDVVISNAYGSVISEMVYLTVRQGFAGLENPGFESDLAGWTVSGNLGVQNAPPYQPSEGGKLISFNAADSAPNGVLSQAFDTTPGHLYLLSFEMGALSYNNSAQKLEVEVAGDAILFKEQFAVTGVGGGKTRWITRNLSFTADSGRTTLFFRDRSTVTRSIDLLLDNLSLTTPALRSLSVTCTNSAVDVSISPPDTNGLSNGPAGEGHGLLLRTYRDGQMVRVEVPELIGSSSYPDKSLIYRFKKWQQNGSDAGDSTGIDVLMNGDLNLTAVYEPTAPIITRQLEDMVAGYGATVVLTVEAIGSSDMNYEWYFDGWQFQSGPSNTAVLGGIGSDYEGLYEVVVSNAGGSTKSRAARLTVINTWISNDGFEDGLEFWNATGNVKTQGYSASETGNRNMAAFNVGNSSPTGILSQQMGVDPGSTYLVTFDLGIVAYNTAEQRMLVRVDGDGPLFQGEYTIKGRGNGLTVWQRKSLVFTADSHAATFSFTDKSAITNAIDLLLDNVNVQRMPDGYVPVPAGSFIMGSPIGEIGRFSNETQHPVTLTRSFMMKRTEVTWDEWMNVKSTASDYGYNDLGSGLRGSNGLAGGNHPVTFVTWWDAVKWCNLASERMGLRPVYYTHPSLGDTYVLRNGMASIHADWTAGGYRLPSSAEWEYACRAGTTTAFHTGHSTNPDYMGPDPNMDLAGWYLLNSSGSTHPVGLKTPNAWGLHDMHGNVWEHCWDYWFEGATSSAPAVDPRGSSTPSPFRSHRGGSWGNYADNCRSAHSHGTHPDGSNQGEGFRPVLNMGP